MSQQQQAPPEQNIQNLRQSIKQEEMKSDLNKLVRKHLKNPQIQANWLKGITEQPKDIILCTIFKFFELEKNHKENYSTAQLAHVKEQSQQIVLDKYFAEQSSNADYITEQGIHYVMQKNKKLSGKAIFRNGYFHDDNIIIKGGKKKKSLDLDDIKTEKEQLKIQKGKSVNLQNKKDFNKIDLYIQNKKVTDEKKKKKKLKLWPRDEERFRLYILHKQKKEFYMYFKYASQVKKAENYIKVANIVKKFKKSQKTEQPKQLKDTFSEIAIRMKSYYFKDQFIEKLHQHALNLKLQSSIQDINQKSSNQTSKKSLQFYQIEEEDHEDSYLTNQIDNNTQKSPEKDQEQLQQLPSQQEKQQSGSSQNNKSLTQPTQAKQSQSVYYDDSQSIRLNNYESVDDEQQKSKNNLSNILANNITDDNINVIDDSQQEKEKQQTIHDDTQASNEAKKLTKKQTKQKQKIEEEVDSSDQSLSNIRISHSRSNQSSKKSLAHQNSKKSLKKKKKKKSRSSSSNSSKSHSSSSSNETMSFVGNNAKKSFQNKQQVLQTFIQQQIDDVKEWNDNRKNNPQQIEQQQQLQLQEDQYQSPHFQGHESNHLYTSQAHTANFKSPRTVENSQQFQQSSNRLQQQQQQNFRLSQQEDPYSLRPKTDSQQQSFDQKNNQQSFEKQLESYRVKQQQLQNDQEQSTSNIHLQNQQFIQQLNENIKNINESISQHSQSIHSNLQQTSPKVSQKNSLQNKYQQQLQQQQQSPQSTQYDYNNLNNNQDPSIDKANSYYVVQQQTQPQQQHQNSQLENNHNYSTDKDPSQIYNIEIRKNNSHIVLDNQSISTIPFKQNKSHSNQTNPLLNQNPTQSSNFISPRDFEDSQHYNYNNLQQQDQRQKSQSEIYQSEPPQLQQYNQNPQISSSQKLTSPTKQQKEFSFQKNQVTSPVKTKSNDFYSQLLNNSVKKPNNDLHSQQLAKQLTGEIDLKQQQQHYSSNVQSSERKQEEEKIDNVDQFNSIEQKIIQEEEEKSYQNNTSLSDSDAEHIGHVQQQYRKHQKQQQQSMRSFKTNSSNSSLTNIQQQNEQKNNKKFSPSQQDISNITDHPFQNEEIHRISNVSNINRQTIQQRNPNVYDNWHSRSPSNDQKNSKNSSLHNSQQLHHSQKKQNKSPSPSNNNISYKVNVQSPLQSLHSNQKENNTNNNSGYYSYLQQQNQQPLQNIINSTKISQQQQSPQQNNNEHVKRAVHSTERSLDVQNIQYMPPPISSNRSRKSSRQDYNPANMDYQQQQYQYQQQRRAQEPEDSSSSDEEQFSNQKSNIKKQQQNLEHLYNSLQKDKSPQQIFLQINQIEILNCQNQQNSLQHQQEMQSSNIKIDIQLINQYNHSQNIKSNIYAQFLQQHINKYVYSTPPNNQIMLDLHQIKESEYEKYTIQITIEFQQQQINQSLTLHQLLHNKYTNNIDIWISQQFQQFYIVSLHMEQFDNDNIQEEEEQDSYIQNLILPNQQNIAKDILQLLLYQDNEDLSIEQSFSYNFYSQKQKLQSLQPYLEKIWKKQQQLMKNLNNTNIIQLYRDFNYLVQLGIPQKYRVDTWLQLGNIQNIQKSFNPTSQQKSLQQLYQSISQQSLQQSQQNNSENKNLFLQQSIEHISKLYQQQYHQTKNINEKIHELQNIVQNLHLYLKQSNKQLSQFIFPKEFIYIIQTLQQITTTTITQKTSQNVSVLLGSQNLSTTSQKLTTSQQQQSSEYKLYFLLVIIVQNLLLKLYSDQKHLKNLYLKLNLFLQQELPDLFKHIQENIGISFEFLFHSHLLSLFSQLFNQQLLQRIWDILFLEIQNKQYSLQNVYIAIIASLLQEMEEVLLQIYRYQDIQFTLQQYCSYQLKNSDNFIKLIYQNLNSLNLQQNNQEEEQDQQQSSNNLHNFDQKIQLYEQTIFATHKKELLKQAKFKEFQQQQNQHQNYTYSHILNLIQTPSYQPSQQNMDKNIYFTVQSLNLKNPNIFQHQKFELKVFYHDQQQYFNDLENMNDANIKFKFPYIYDKKNQQQQLYIQLIHTYTKYQLQYVDQYAGIVELDQYKQNTIFNNTLKLNQIQLVEKQPYFVPVQFSLQFTLLKSAQNQEKMPNIFSQKYTKNFDFYNSWHKSENDLQYLFDNNIISLENNNTHLNVYDQYQQQQQKSKYLNSVFLQQQLEFFINQIDFEKYLSQSLQYTQQQIHQINQIFQFPSYQYQYIDIKCFLLQLILNLQDTLDSKLELLYQLILKIQEQQQNQNQNQELSNNNLISLQTLKQVVIQLYEKTRYYFPLQNICNYLDISLYQQPSLIIYSELQFSQENILDITQFIQQISQKDTLTKYSKKFIILDQQFLDQLKNHILQYSPHQQLQNNFTLYIQASQQDFIQEFSYNIQFYQGELQLIQQSTQPPVIDLSSYNKFITKQQFYQIMESLPLLPYLLQKQNYNSNVNIQQQINLKNFKLQIKLYVNNKQKQKFEVVQELHSNSFQTNFSTTSDLTQIQLQGLNLYQDIFSVLHKFVQQLQLSGKYSIETCQILSKNSSNLQHLNYHITLKNLIQQFGNQVKIQLHISQQQNTKQQLEQTNNILPQQAFKNYCAFQINNFLTLQKCNIVKEFKNKEAKSGNNNKDHESDSDEDSDNEQQNPQYIIQTPDNTNYIADVQQLIINDNNSQN